jgi:DNA-binding beta-propeller fold protein YncE
MDRCERGIGFRTSWTVGAAVALLALSAPAAHANRLYATGQTPGNVASFSIGTDGALTAIGAPVAADNGADGAALTPDGRYLYVAAYFGGISAYSVAGDGSLSPISGSPFPAGSGSSGVVVTPDGRHLYIANYVDNTVSAYSIAADGSLTPVSGSPFVSAGGPFPIAASPDGKTLLVGDYDSDDVRAFSIAADGSLTPVPGSPFAAGFSPAGVTVTPDGVHVYVSDSGSSEISAYSIAADGSLSPVTGSPFAAPGSAPVGVAVSPDGKRLLMADQGNQVFAFSIAANGTLSGVAGSPYPSGGLPRGAAVTPDSKWFYSTAGSNTVSGYSIAGDGGLAPISGSPFASGVSDSYIQSVAISPDQSPVASFTGTDVLRGSPTAFNASASSDPDGTVARYDWDFGDGTSLADGGPTPNHTYAAAGDFQVKLTVTDNEACSTALVYTGQTVSCNGSAVASKSQTVAVTQPPNPPDPPPVITKLAVNPKSFSADPTATPLDKSGTNILVTVSEDATVKLRIRANPPRKGGGPTPAQPHVFRRQLLQGDNTVPFTATLGNRTFAPGKYLVIARARDSADQLSDRVQAKFTVTP